MRPGSPARRRLTPALLVMAMVAALLPLGQAATAATNTALQFNGTTQYATLGDERANCARARSSRWRLWFRRTGTGTVIDGTGTGDRRASDHGHPVDREGSSRGGDALASGHQLLPRDRQSASNKLAADFEEARGARSSSAGLEPPDHRQPLSITVERLAPRCCDVRRRRLATSTSMASNDGTLTVNRVANSATSVDHLRIGTSLNTDAPR